MSLLTSKEARWTRELHGPDTLNDDLGWIGCWVGPRVGPNKRTQDQREDYTLRRLLVAWKYAGRLEFPATIQAERQRDGEPNYVMTFPGGENLGIEIAEAGSPAWQTHLTHLEKKGLSEPTADPDEFAEDRSRTINEIVSSIRRKAKRIQEGSYLHPNNCDLAVYDNTAWGGVESKSQLVEGVRTETSALGKHFRQVHLIFSDSVWLDVLGNQAERVEIKDRYEIDYANWLSAQVEALRERHSGAIDFSNIAEELEDLGRRERRAVRSQLRRLLIHLLKWRYQPQERSGSWSSSIRDARDSLADLFLDSPSLGRDDELVEVVNAQYPKARKTALAETGLHASAIPHECPFSLGQLLDDEFFPDESADNA